MTRRWQTVLGLTVSLLLLYWVLHDVSLPELWYRIRTANLALLALSVAIATGSFVIRAARWQVFLKPALPASSFRTRFAATCIGFMANNLLPARVGEFARAYAFSKFEPIGVSASFGSLVVERVFDGLTLALFLALPLALPGSLAVPGLGDQLVGKVIFVFVVFGGALLGLLLLAWRPELVTRVFRGTVGRLLPGRTADRVAGIMRSFIEGLGAMRRPGLVVSGFLWSVAHWCWAALGLYVGMLAFGITEPGYVGALFLQAVNAFLVAIPSSPGFFGPFEASVRLGLSPWGVEPVQTASFAMAYHIGAFIPVTVIGLYYVWRMGLSWGDVRHSDEMVEASE